jgi:hypothetical protein
VDSGLTNVLAETSVLLAELGERQSRTENSASGKENCERRKKLAVINLLKVLLLYISDKKIVKMTNILATRVSTILRCQMYISVFMCNAFMAWCSGHDPCCCSPKQLLSSPWYTICFPQSSFRHR